MTTLRIAKLERHHAIEQFDCGQGDLNRFLVQYALQNQLANASTTYVALADDTVIGYYTLVVGEVAYDDAPDRLIKGMARFPVLLMVLARLATDQRWQKMGIGKGMLKDAMLRTLNAADIAGIRALAVHAKDDNARAFYEHFDFLPSPTDPLHLYLLMKDLRQAVRKGSLSERLESLSFMFIGDVGPPLARPARRLPAIPARSAPVQPAPGWSWLHPGGAHRAAARWEERGA